MDKYEFLSRHGAGSYAVVWKARRKNDGHFVAIKQLKECVTSWDAVKALPEVQFLSILRSHSNIVKLEEVVKVHDQAFLVFEYCDGNLYQTMQSMLREGNGFQEAEVRWLMRDVLNALAHVHKKNCLHRDIKPENILLSDAKRAAKLCDFGQAKSVNGTGKFTAYVSTRWYRAPELMLQAPRYGPAADMWAVGVMMAELYAMRPIFAGTSELDQLFKIASVIGAPNHWREGQSLARAMGYSFPDVEPLGLASVVTAAGPEALDFMNALLQFDPSMRLSAAQALRHPFMTNPRVKVIRPINPKVKASDEQAAREAAASLVSSMGNADAFREHNKVHSPTSKASRSTHGHGLGHHGDGSSDMKGRSSYAGSVESKLGAGGDEAVTASGRLARANHAAYLEARSKARAQAHAAKQGQGMRGGGSDSSSDDSGEEKHAAAEIFSNSGGGYSARGRAAAGRRDPQPPSGGNSSSYGSSSTPAGRRRKGSDGRRARWKESSAGSESWSGSGRSTLLRRGDNPNMVGSRLDLHAAAAEEDEEEEAKHGRGRGAGRGHSPIAGRRGGGDTATRSSAVDALSGGAPASGFRGHGRTPSKGKPRAGRRRELALPGSSFGSAPAHALTSFGQESPRLSPMASPLESSTDSANIGSALTDMAPVTSMFGRRGGGGFGRKNSRGSKPSSTTASPMSALAGSGRRVREEPGSGIASRLKNLGASFEDVSYDVGATLGSAMTRSGRRKK